MSMSFENGRNMREESATDISLATTTFNGGSSLHSSNATVVVNNLSIVAPSTKNIATKLSFSVSPGERLAIIGSEGCGKSTVLEYLAGLPREGFDYRGEGPPLGSAGYLPQELDSRWEELPLIHFLFEEKPTDEPDYGNWNYQTDAVRSLKSVGLGDNLNERQIDDFLEQPVGTLSGGQKVRAQLAKILLKNPPCLLLDEPTNNLDIATIKWLEGFLTRSRVPQVIVTHDETLVRKVATSILYMAHRSYDNRAFAYFSSEGYDDFRDRLARSVEKAENEKGNLKREIRELTVKQAEFNNRVAGAANFQRGAGAAEKSAMRRGERKASGQSGAQQQKIEDKKSELKNFEIPYYESDGHIDFPNDCAVPRGKLILTLQNTPITVPGRTLVESASLTIVGPEKIGVIGENGIGKSTLIKMIRGMDQLTGVRLGYMPQDFREILDNPERSALQFLRDQGETEATARTYLSRMGFSPTEVENGVGSLSGGQRGKLLILKMAIDRANFLILDEPTRNLSPLTAPVLREEIKSFPGAALVVSHDRLFLKEVCTKVVELTRSGFQEVEKESLLS